MIDPRRMLEKLAPNRRDKPFRYLGRRVIQTMAEAARENPLLARRTSPGRYLVVRLVEDEGQADEWDRLFQESRETILDEIRREAQSREIDLLGEPGLELFLIRPAVLRDERTAAFFQERLGDAAEAVAQLEADRELILPHRSRVVLVETDPPGAQAYVDHRQVGITPCRVEDPPEPAFTLTLSVPGFLAHEERISVAEMGPRGTHRVSLVKEPPMGFVEITSYPPGARVTVGAETRDCPSLWRLPAGPCEMKLQLPGYQPETLLIEVEEGPELRPRRHGVRLRYAGPDRDEVLGTLVVYRPGPSGEQLGRRENTIGSFFRDADPGATLDDWAFPGQDQPIEILAEVPLRRGVLLIGRDDPELALRPNIVLSDQENSVSRGCHAWLWVYDDTATGAAFNAFLIGNRSPSGIMVDGALVMETRRLSEDSRVRIGNFHLRIRKEIPSATVRIVDY